MSEESKIVLPESEDKPEEEELKYPATEADEEKFFLMYHLNWAPSEVDSLSEDRRKWIIARFVGQKHMEKDMMDQMRIRQQLAQGGVPNFKVTE
jgi:hypothetical protein